MVVEHGLVERDRQRVLRAEANRVLELLVVVDAGDVEDPHADPVARDAEADVLARQLVAREEALERLGERFRIAQLTVDDDALRERLARDLQQLRGAVVRHARGGDLRAADLQADVTLDCVTACTAGCARRALRHRHLRPRQRALAPQDRAMLTAWIFHLVGDIHQPLHSSTLVSQRLFPEGDRGGNSIKLKQSYNLHALWDGTAG